VYRDGVRERKLTDLPSGVFNEPPVPKLYYDFLVFAVYLNDCPHIAIVYSRWINLVVVHTLADAVVDAQVKVSDLKDVGFRMRGARIEFLLYSFVELECAQWATVSRC
jgi:hypothetical protein